MVPTFALTPQTALLEDLLFVLVSHTASWAYLHMRTSREYPMPTPLSFLCDESFNPSNTAPPAVLALGTALLTM